jgi:hypothetical protein
VTEDTAHQPVWITDKACIVVRDDLAPWQELNVAAFLTSGIGTTHPSYIGEPYRDASGREYPPMLALPIRVYTGNGAALRRAFDRALSRGLKVSVYTRQMFETGDDIANRAAVAEVATDNLDLVGFLVVGERRDVDKALDKVSLHA